MLLKIGFNVKSITQRSRPMKSPASALHEQPQAPVQAQTLYEQIAAGHALADAEDAANRLWQGR